MGWTYRLEFENDTTCLEEDLIALVGNNSIPFNPDITGLGVLAGFLVTSISAILTVLFAYTTYSIPTELTNEADQVLCSFFRDSFASVRKIFCIPGLAKTRDRHRRDDRTKAFTAFLLSGSDQILVSEFAILTAAIAGYRDITIYSVEIVIALGCMASTVHLLTLPLLTRNIKEGKFTKTLRVLVITAVTGMLVYLLCYRLSDDWWSPTTVFFRCVRMRWNMRYPIEFIVTSAVPVVLIFGTLQAIMQIFELGSDNDDAEEAVLAEEQEGGRRISREQSRPRRREPGNRDSQPPRGNGSQGGGGTSTTGSQGDNDLSQQETDQIHRRDPNEPASERFRRRERRDRRYDTALRLDRPTSHPRESDIELREIQLEHGLDSHTNGANQHQMQVRGGDGERLDIQIDRKPFTRIATTFQRVLRKLSRENRNRMFILRQQHEARRALRTEGSASRLNRVSFYMTVNWAFNAFEQSLIWRLLWACTGTTYGVAAVFVARGKTTGMSGDRQKLGFGQIVPLALLFLPILAAMQSVHEYRKQTNERDEDNSSSEEEEEEGEHSEAGEEGQSTGNEDSSVHPDLIAWSRARKPAVSNLFATWVHLYFLSMLIIMSTFAVSAAYEGALFEVKVVLVHLIGFALVVKLWHFIRVLWWREPKS